MNCAGQVDGRAMCTTAHSEAPAVHSGAHIMWTAQLDSHARARDLIRLVSSLIWLNTLIRSAIRPRIFRSACMTVVWSRPPKVWPIFGSDRSVSSRHRYMAICRALTSTRLRELPVR